jgi:hypothetical protein
MQRTVTISNHLSDRVAVSQAEATARVKRRQAAMGLFGQYEVGRFAVSRGAPAGSVCALLPKGVVPNVSG